MKIFTVNSNKSTTIGGVEGLIRSIQKIKKNTELVELYRAVGSKETMSESSFVDYINFAVEDSRSTILNKIKTKLKQLKTLSSRCNNENDIVIVFHPNDILYIPLKVLKKSKIILVQTNKFDKYFEPFSKVIMYFLVRYINYVTVYTDIDKTELIKLYPKLEKRIKVIPRGCRIKTCDVERDCNKKLVSIARIDEQQKNFTGMLEIFSMLPEGYSLDIYGGGAVEEIEGLKERIDQCSGVTFKGELSDVAPVLREYNLFLMTSHYEGFGQTLIEARSQGLPIVAYNTFDALQWIVIDDFNGYKVEKDNKNKFVESIINVCENVKHYEQLSKNALAKSVETDMKHVESLWCEIL